MPLTYSRVLFGGIGAGPARDPGSPSFVTCATIPGDSGSGTATCNVTTRYELDLSVTMADLLVAAGVPGGGYHSPYGPVYYYVKCQAAVNAPDVATKGCYNAALQGPWVPGSGSCGPLDFDGMSNVLDVSGGTGVWFGGPDALDSVHQERDGADSFVQFIAWMVNPTTHADAINTGQGGVSNGGVPYVLPANTAFLYAELPSAFSMVAVSNGNHAPLGSMVMQLFVLAPTGPAPLDRAPGAFTAGPAIAGVLGETHRVIGSAKASVSAAGASWDGFSNGVGSPIPSDGQSGVVRP